MSGTPSTLATSAGAVGFATVLHEGRHDQPADPVGRSCGASPVPRPSRSREGRREACPSAVVEPAAPGNRLPVDHTGKPPTGLTVSEGAGGESDARTPPAPPCRSCGRGGRRAVDVPRRVRDALAVGRGEGGPVRHRVPGRDQPDALPGVPLAGQSAPCAHLPGATHDLLPARTTPPPDWLGKARLGARRVDSHGFCQLGRDPPVRPAVHLDPEPRHVPGGRHGHPGEMDYREARRSARAVSSPARPRPAEVLPVSPLAAGRRMP